MTYDDFRAGEKQGWDARADAYGTATARATVQSIPDLLAAVRLAPGMRILDVCCGPGYAAGAAAALGAEARGIDFAPQMVRQAQARFPGLAFDEGDAERLAFPDASFDAVLCNFGLFHVTAPELAMSEAFRVLRPGGHFAFSQWCAPDENPVHRLTLDIVRRLADMNVAPSAPDAFILSSRHTAKGMMAQAGFTDIALRDVPILLRAPAEDFFDFMMRFGVRIPLILERQTEAVRAAIRKACDVEAQAFRSGDEIHLPMPGIVVSGQKEGLLP
ncbi:class I SAM-dependent methyltransferase [Pararhodobacter sp. SW119]|uniref:class I SAM-dependent methyltransferase n=1 Tax=Pararhodobacter sp. SW119 TaxID=2780075 RepID=UPI001AE0063F|nr:class I SAM-dependent methyltransferase [Pararhodobacter sp. SW119]